MNLKDNFNKKEISNTFQILQDKVGAFLKREKQSWAEFEYEEKLARMVDAWDHLNARRILAVGGSVIAVGMIAFTVYVATQPNAYLLEIDGTQVGYVESEELVAEAIVAAAEDLELSLGVDRVAVDEKAIICTATREKSLELLDDQEVEALIMGSDACKVDAWTIAVNGNELLTVASQEIANQVLLDVKNNYKSENAEIVGFSYKEPVAIEPVVATVQELTPANQAVSYILKGSKEPQTYTVQPGDTLWDIASANHMKPAELAAVNPDFQPDRLKVGQVLNLVAVKPYLTVSLKEKVVTNQPIPFATTYEKSDSLTRGQSKVKSAGKNGQKQIVSEVATENGRVVATKVVSETVIAPPVTQVAYQGTKAVVLKAGSGRLNNPLSGGLVVSDRFGASRGSTRRHAGVDLRAPKGTSIYAADGGTVTKVSSGGSYGKLVVVSHGNGLETRYAHCSSICVSTGDKISKGEKLGTVGSTGNATGNVLHFEVRVNGSAVNPLNYLK